MRKLAEEIPEPEDARIVRGGASRRISEWRALKQAVLGEPQTGPGRPRLDLVELYADYVDAREGYRIEFGTPPPPVDAPLPHDKAIRMIARLSSHSSRTALRRLWDGHAALRQGLGDLVPEDDRRWDIEQLIG